VPCLNEPGGTSDQVKHKPFCFALEPSPCEGYFSGGEPPCVCNGSGALISALSQVALPVVPVMAEESVQSETTAQ